MPFLPFTFPATFAPSTSTSKYGSSTLLFGPLLPDYNGLINMLGPLIPDGVIPPLPIGGVGPSGAGTFAIDLETDTKVTWTWVTSLIKSYSGREQRESLLDAPKETFDGSCLLVNSQAREVRARLARGGASGQPFLLGLPHEEITVLSINSTDGRILNVKTTANSDWATIVGQRAIIINPQEEALEVVVQSYTSTTISLDVDVSSIFTPNSRIMPAVPILLEPQQGFARYPGDETQERWQLRARRSTFGFRSAGVGAYASLTASTTMHGMLAQLVALGSAGNGSTLQFQALKNATATFSTTHILSTVVTSGFTGILGNLNTLEFRNDGGILGLYCDGTPDVAVVCHFRPGVDSVSAAFSVIHAFCGMTFSTSSAALLTNADVVGPVSLTGGVGLGTVGLFGVGTTWHFYFSDAITTVATMIADCAAVFNFTGTYNALDCLVNTIDEITVTFAGGSDATNGTFGRGATLNRIGAGPIWDRMIQVKDTAADSVQLMTSILDFDGVPVAIGTADVPDWGRFLRIESGDPLEYQWMKLFLATARGRQNAFMVPTWRADLEWVSGSVLGVSTLTVSSTEEHGDFFAWWPTQRQYLQVWQVDGTLTYLEIQSAHDNGDGTITIVCADPLSGLVVQLSSSTVHMISWLEQCRFESDSFDITFSGHVFAMETTARVVQQ